MTLTLEKIETGERLLAQANKDDHGTWMQSSDAQAEWDNWAFSNAAALLSAARRSIQVELGPDWLEEVRARHEEDKAGLGEEGFYVRPDQALLDRAALLSEVDRLRAENEALHQDGEATYAAMAVAKPSPSPDILKALERVEQIIETLSDMARFPELDATEELYLESDSLLSSVKQQVGNGGIKSVNFDPNTAIPMLAVIEFGMWNYRKTVTQKVMVGRGYVHWVENAVNQIYDSLPTEGLDAEISYIILNDGDVELMCSDDDDQQEDWLMSLVVGATLRPLPTPPEGEER